MSTDLVTTTTSMQVQQVMLSMTPECAARFQTALQWASVKLARQRSRTDAVAQENLSWLNWGSCLIAGESGSAPPPPMVEEKPDPQPLQPGTRDARGYLRTIATDPTFHVGRSPKNKGRTYPATPPTTGEIIALMQACRDDVYGHRMRALIVLLWRSALRVSEALALQEDDLKRPAVTVRCGKGGKRRTVGMDPWAWNTLAPWLEERQEYPLGPIFCVLTGPTAGRRWNDMQVRNELRKLRDKAGIRKRIAPHQLRHAWAVERLREGTPLPVIQRQLGHSNLAVTSTYLTGMTNDEVMDHATNRSAPTLAIPDLMEVLSGT